jgi:hypothetical protein
LHPDARQKDFAMTDITQWRAVLKVHLAALDVLRFLHGPGRRGSAQPPGWVQQLEDYALGRLSALQLIDILADRIAGDPAATQALEALRAAVNTGIPDFLDRTRTAAPAASEVAS